MTKSQTGKGRKVDTKTIVISIILTILISSGSFYAGQVSAQNKYFADSNAGAISLLPSETSRADQKTLTAPADAFDADLFWQVWSLVQKEYVDHDKLDPKKMFYGALKGLVESTGDPYTTFFDPAENKDFQADVTGKFEGIGAEIGLKDDLITVIAPLEGMPAGKAGVRAGDKIIEVNGTSTIGMTVNQAVSKIRGPKNTQVILTILRDKVKNPLKITITRNLITIKSVKKTVKDGIATIRVNNFNEDTAIEFNQAVNEVVASKATGLIVDLRNNPGGYLNVAISMTGKWVGKQTAVIEKYGQGKESVLKASGTPVLKNIKTVVLINEGSASASEILAGALQDYKLAVLVGKKTYGKGSVQTLEDLPDGSAVKITSAKWLTPLGRSIDKEGIKPDVDVTISEADIKAGKDTQMTKALEVLKNYSKYIK